MENLIKDGDIILDGTLTREQKEKQAFEKLGQLENIEQELGIDLITLFKALKDGVWVKFWAGIGYYDKPFLRTDVKPYSIDFSFTSGFQHQKLTDYGKTWALTKEELE